ncbi:hypothetical protein ES703_49444 [subsurface metagenome]
MPELLNSSSSNVLHTFVLPQFKKGIVYICQFALQVRDGDGIDGRFDNTVLYPQSLLILLALYRITQTPAQSVTIYVPLYQIVLCTVL